MNRLIAVGLAALLVGCGETPTQPPAELDVDAQFAAAGAAAGADVWQDAWDHDDCHTWDGGTYCHAYKGKVHQVATPSGNMYYFYREDGWWSQNLYSGYSYQSEGTYEYKFHLRKGQPQVESWERTSESTYTSGGTTLLCSDVARYHYANGHVTKDISDYTCTVS